MHAIDCFAARLAAIACGKKSASALLVFGVQLVAASMTTDETFEDAMRQVRAAIDALETTDPVVGEAAWRMLLDNAPVGSTGDQLARALVHVGEGRFFFTEGEPFELDFRGLGSVHVVAALGQRGISFSADALQDGSTNMAVDVIRASREEAAGSADATTWKVVRGARGSGLAESRAHTGCCFEWTITCHFIS